MTGPSSKVVVVGGSAAGAFTAALLAVDGHDVTLVDQSEMPGAERRTLIVTERMGSVLDPAIAAGCVRNRIEAFELYANGFVGHVRLARPDLVIERSTLVTDLLQAARSAGATILPRHRFSGFEGDRSVGLSGPAGPVSIQARVVVGADGASSAVAQSVGVRHEYLSLLQALVPRPNDLPARTARVWFVPDATPYFFWMIPDAEDQVAVGLISAAPSSIRATLDRFLEERSWHPSAYQAARVPRYRRWIPPRRRWGERDVYLVGDAAAQVKISTVGGVVTGLLGASIAAQMISAATRSSAALRLRWELGLHSLIRRSLDGFDERAYVDLLGSMSIRTRRALGVSSRDAATAMLLRSIPSSPRIAWLGLRGLLRADSA